MPAKLKNGVKGASGGKRKNAGRKPDWLNAQVRKIGDPLKILRFYWDVTNGKALEQVVTDSGETIRVAASVKDRLKAGELYLDRHPDVGPILKKLEHSGHVSLEEFVSGSYKEGNG